MKSQEYWLCHYIQPVTKEKTYCRYTEIAERHLIPKLGDKDLSEISFQEIQWFVTDELQHGNMKTGAAMSPNSVNLTISVIQNSMRTANTLGLVPTYELHKLKRPNVPLNQQHLICSSEVMRNSVIVRIPGALLEALWASNRAVRLLLPVR